MSILKSPFDRPKSPERPTRSGPPVSSVTLIQCIRNGAAIAHILNWLGDAKPGPDESWLKAFDHEIDERGLLVLRQICEACGVTWAPANAARAAMIPPQAQREATDPVMAAFHKPVITPRMHVPIEEV